ncbi:MAG: O-antigen ligase family protein [Acidobacteria bacterium]|nr:O-antigen ligase family protein [Acidobacteriota bacterium]
MSQELLRRLGLGAVARRQGPERLAFSLFLLGCAVIPGIGVANVVLGACLVTTLWWRFTARRAGEPFLGPFARTTPLHGPWGAYVALYVASAAFSTLPSRTLLEMKGLGTYLLLFFAMALLQDGDDVDLLLDLLRITTIYLVFRGLGQWVLGWNNLDKRVTGGLSTYMTYTGVLMVFGLLLLARALDSSRPRAGRLLDASAAALAVVATVLTFTRSAYLGFAAGALALLGVKRPKFLVALPVAVLLAFVLAPASVQIRAISSFDPSDPSTRDRVSMWKSGLAMVADRPIFGVGPKRTKVIYPVYRRPEAIEQAPGHLHNNMLQVAAQSGLPALTAYLVFCGVFLREAWRRTRGGPSASVSAGSLAAFVALFAAGLFEFNFGDVEVLMSLLVACALPFVGTTRIRPS